MTPVTPAAPPDPTQLASGDYTSSVILNRIFEILLTMVTSLQNVAAAQANLLNFETNWQSVYTDVESQVHTFTQGGGGAFSGSDSTSATHRNDMNRLNSNFIQTLQNRQSVVANNAKALQSNVNQSNDAVNQQSNLGTAILQELSTLLSTIFH
jgi:N-methylhydantoinase B/oxoprolinase/acetone carboxylase alpha subunit